MQPNWKKDEFNLDQVTMAERFPPDSRLFLAFLHMGYIPLIRLNWSTGWPRLDVMESKVPIGQSVSLQEDVVYVQRFLKPS